MNAADDEGCPRPSPKEEAVQFLMSHMQALEEGKTPPDPPESLLMRLRPVGPARVGRFCAEAEPVGKVTDPDIVQIYGVGECDGLPYLALEFLDDGTLEKKLAGTPWPPHKAAETVQILALAVHHVHLRGVIH